MFKERLKTLRKEAGLTQKEIANILKISQPSYAQWENGRTKPRGETLEKFANFFNVSTDYLLGLSDIKNTEQENELTEQPIFAERLKALRKEAGLTQKDIANHFQFSQPAYQQWESGKKKPSAETLEKFANFFNVSTDYLLGNTDYKNSLEQDIEEAIQRSVAYDGKPITDNDKKIITDFLKDYFAKKSD